MNTGTARPEQNSQTGSPNVIGNANDFFEVDEDDQHENTVPVTNIPLGPHEEAKDIEMDAISQTRLIQDSRQRGTALEGKS